MFDQSISKTSQIQFFLSFTFSGFNFPLILNRQILLASLHNFIDMYEWVLDTKSNILVLLENKHPLKKLDFLVSNNFLHSRNIILEIGQAFAHCCELPQD